MSRYSIYHIASAQQEVRTETMRGVQLPSRHGNTTPPSPGMVLIRALIDSMYLPRSADDDHKIEAPPMLHARPVVCTQTSVISAGAPLCRSTANDGCYKENIQEHKSIARDGQQQRLYLSRRGTYAKTMCPLRLSSSRTLSSSPEGLRSAFALAVIERMVTECLPIAITASSKSLVCLEHLIRTSLTFLSAFLPLDAYHAILFISTVRRMSGASAFEPGRTCNQCALPYPYGRRGLPA